MKEPSQFCTEEIDRQQQFSSKMKNYKQLEQIPNVENINEEKVDSKSRQKQLQKQEMKIHSEIYQQTTIQLQEQQSLLNFNVQEDCCLNQYQIHQNQEAQRNITYQQNNISQPSNDRSSIDPPNINQEHQQVYIQSHLFDPEYEQQNNRQSRQQNQRNSSANERESEQQLPRWSVKEKNCGIIDDPELKEKQEILTQINEILKHTQIRARTKRHSILEDALQLCILYLPQLRGEYYQLNDERLYKKLKLEYNLPHVRNFEGFKRRYFIQAVCRFYHFSIFLHCWTVDNLSKIHQIISKFQEYPLDCQYINYDIRNKTIGLPSSPTRVRMQFQLNQSDINSEILKCSQEKQQIIPSSI